MAGTAVACLALLASCSETDIYGWVTCSDTYDGRALFHQALRQDPRTASAFYAGYWERDDGSRAEISVDLGGLAALEPGDYAFSDFREECARCYPVEEWDTSCRIVCGTISLDCDPELWLCREIYGIESGVLTIETPPGPGFRAIARGLEAVESCSEESICIDEMVLTIEE